MGSPVLMSVSTFKILRAMQPTLRLLSRRDLYFKELKDFISRFNYKSCRLRLKWVRQEPQTKFAEFASHASATQEQLWDYISNLIFVQVARIIMARLLHLQVQDHLSL